MQPSAVRKTADNVMLKFCYKKGKKKRLYTFCPFNTQKMYKSTTEMINIVLMWQGHANN